jgi:SAM-dependent methyltransferase
VKAADWDERYRIKELVWGAGPNVWVHRELADLAPGRAVDLACGEGRNAMWLASLGWRVLGVDFSAVALDKARELQVGGGAVTQPVTWQCADATTVDLESSGPYDLALICYLQLPARGRRAVVARAANALAPGGTLLVIAHDSANLAEGTGGPQYPEVLYTAADVSADLAGSGLVIDIAEAVRRTVEGAERQAIDALLRAHRPGSDASSPTSKAPNR